VGAPLYAELRYWPELAGLMADGRFRSPARESRRPPVLLIPGFMAGDASLTLLAGWLRRRGHAVRLSGIRLNTGCAGRELTRLEEVLAGFDEPAIVIGQSRGGTLARALAARCPDAVAAVVMLGSPVLDPLAVSAGIMRTVRSVARLGDLGVPGVFSSKCRDGDCCSDYYALLRAPLNEDLVALMIYSRSDAIVDWHACLDPSATCVEINGSHCGMSVNARVYAELERVLERAH
jgi:triacylglycerol lipase